MRFLKTETYEIEEFGPRPSPPYAVLSHTWLTTGDKYLVREITYQDTQSNMKMIKDGNYKQDGWAKLKAFCDLAKSDGWKYAWMDTSCIDKTNPSDTQEAINAMFRWYSLAGVCYAHLDGVERPKEQDHPKKFSEEFRDAFRSAIWFTRIWTLQELLAPPNLVFVDKDWKNIGTKEELAGDIAAACNMDVADLTEYPKRSVAARLSWAARRKSTLEEDKAYALLGLFGISMPLCYGEGQLAFGRFQAELIKVHNDPSIFSWCFNSSGRETYENSGRIISPSLACFKNCGNVYSRRTSFALSNTGLTITGRLSEVTFSNMPLTMRLKIIRLLPEDTGNNLLELYHVLWLDCWEGPSGNSGPDTPSPNCIGISLGSSPNSEETYNRLGPAFVYQDLEAQYKLDKVVKKTILIREPEPKIFSRPRFVYCLKFELKQLTFSNMAFRLRDSSSALRLEDEAWWPTIEKDVVDPSLFKTVFTEIYYEHAVLQLKTKEEKTFRLLLESKARGGLVCSITDYKEMDQLTGDGIDRKIGNIQPRLYPLPPIACRYTTTGLVDVPVYLLEVSID